MIRHVLIFVLTAGIGAVLALAVRSAWHQPYAPAATTPAEQQAPAPTDSPAKPASDPHAGHARPAGKPVAGKPVNDICAICGMKADGKLTAIYREQVIAFGCKACPEEFAANPERYGPYFLKNQEAP